MKKSCVSLAVLLLAAPPWLAPLSAATATAAPAAAASLAPRTNINPALLYWQAASLIPSLTESDHDHVFTNDWRGRPLDARVEALLSRYDSAFNLMRQARQQQVPCDWGYDLSKGPELELPGLAKAKSLAQASRLRVRWHLEQGRPDAAREDFLASFVMGRQLSRDGLLISALVQLAIENIMASSIAENWFRFPSKTLDEVMVGIRTGPARGTMLECVPTEWTAMRDWFALKIRNLQATSESEAEAMRKAIQILRGIEIERSELVDQVVKGAGGTTDGLLRLLVGLDAFYGEVAAILPLPYDEFLPRMKAFDEKVASHTNAFAQVYFTVFSKCQVKQFASEVRLAMVQAAIEYRRSGNSGLESVPDPITGRPFEFRRFFFEGVDRGFELKSHVLLREWPEVLIFLEKEGPLFYLDGPRAGQAAK